MCPSLETMTILSTLFLMKAGDAAQLVEHLLRMHGACVPSLVPTKLKPVMVVHICNLSTQIRRQEDLKFKIILTYIELEAGLESMSP